MIRASKYNVGCKPACNRTYYILTGKISGLPVFWRIAKNQVGAILYEGIKDF